MKKINQKKKTKNNIKSILNIIKKKKGNFLK
jgi:hypothetical protein